MANGMQKNAGCWRALAAASLLGCAPPGLPPHAHGRPGAEMRARNEALDRLPVQRGSGLQRAEPVAGQPTQPAASRVAPEAPGPAAPGEATTPPPRAPQEPAPTAPFTLADDLERTIAVYPPTSAEGPRPAVVMLHATCMQPAPLCDAFGQAGRDVGWLVCPAGNSTCYGEPDWHGTGAVKASFLARALEQVDARVGPLVSRQPGVLIGWSRGAFAARDILDAAIASDPPGPLARRFSGLVLIAASVGLDPRHLRAAGIKRVVLAVGDHDGARSSMTSSAAALRRAGLETRYVSLGKIGHQWPGDFEARMSEPIGWAAGAAGGAE
jgi:predicted esterase